MTLDNSENAHPELSPSMQHAIGEATGEYLDKMLSTPDAAKAFGGHYADDEHRRENIKPKAWFNDPFQLLDSIGMGYRANPSQVTYETLRQMTERDTVVGAILGVRIGQVNSFCKPQENKYSIGFKIQPRDKDKRKRLSDSEKERCTRIQNFITHMGLEPNVERDGLRNFMKKSVRDRLTYDQVCWEKTKTRGGGVHEVFVVPGDTIRIAHPRDAKGTPPDVAQLRKMIKYVQIINGEIAAEFTPQELAFCVANPRTSLRTFGYGFPEPQMLITTITAHIWAEEWNRKAFSQGSTIKGVLNMKGNVPPKMYEAFKRQWTAQVAGVHNAWRTPILNSDGIDFTQMQMSNTEMGYQMWIEYLVKIACALYQMDPAEINFDLRGGVGQQPVFMSDNQAQQQESKDRGLKPILEFFEDMINRHIIWCIDPMFEFIFAGLDAKTEEQAIELRQKQGMTTHTLNEMRAMEDLPPVEDGDIVLNPTFTGYKQQLEMAKQQQQMGGMQGGEEEEEQQQPYENVFGQEPGEEEKDGKQKLQQMDKQQESKDKQQKGVDPKTLSSLSHNDWTSTIQQSTRDADLKKSLDDLEAEVLFYDTLDV